MFGRLRAVELDAVLGRARRAKVVGLAAYCYHQGVVGQLLGRGNFTAGVVVAGGQLHGFLLPVHAHQATESELEMVPAGLRQVLDFFGVGVKATGCQLVQQRLPDVGAGGVHQGDFSLAFFAHALA